MESIRSIKTVGPKGIQFRSRLEARWAYIFDSMGWIWEYEPIDLNGYIPDFIVDIPSRNQKDSSSLFGDRNQKDSSTLFGAPTTAKRILVEVKGTIPTMASDFNLAWDIEPHKEKIEKSKWDGDWLIVGSMFCSSLHLPDAVIIGVAGIDGYTPGEMVCIRKTYGVWGLCTESEPRDLGYGDPIGDGQDWQRRDGSSYLEFQTMWSDAQNKCQWKGTQNPYYNPLV